jgi:hypothetical protein
MDIEEPLLLEELECATEPSGLTLARAHRIMRVHAHHPESPCRQRRAALAYLVAAGHYKPARRTDKRR